MVKEATEKLRKEKANMPPPQATPAIKKKSNQKENTSATSDPIIIGETISAMFNDNVIKTLAINPIEIEKQNNGSQYFLSGILNFQNGTKHIKTTNILKLPIKSGGTFSLKITFWIGYALPNKIVIIRINK